MAKSNQAGFATGYACGFDGSLGRIALEANWMTWSTGAVRPRGCNKRIFQFSNGATDRGLL